MLFASLEVSKKEKALMGGAGWEEKLKEGMEAPLNRGKTFVGGWAGRKTKGGRGKKTNKANLQPPLLML
jgi:hypothetical protein